jgi:hypothetical protein
MCHPKDEALDGRKAFCGGQKKRIARAALSLAIGWSLRPAIIIDETTARATSLASMVTG